MGNIKTLGEIWQCWYIKRLRGCQNDSKNMPRYCIYTVYLHNTYHIWRPWGWWVWGVAVLQGGSKRRTYSQGNTPGRPVTARMYSHCCWLSRDTLRLCSPLMGKVGVLVVVWLVRKKKVKKLQRREFIQNWGKQEEEKGEEIRQPAYKAGEGNEEKEREEKREENKRQNAYTTEKEFRERREDASHHCNVRIDKVVQGWKFLRHELGEHSKWGWWGKPAGLRGWKYNKEFW